MKLSEKHIKSLRPLLMELHGLDYTNEQLQEAGMAIMRFVILKAQRKQALPKNEENGYGQPNGQIKAATK